MVHSAQGNKDVNECTLAVKEITHVRKFVKPLDQETHSISQVQHAVFFYVSNVIVCIFRGSFLSSCIQYFL